MANVVRYLQCIEGSARQGPSGIDAIFRAMRYIAMRSLSYRDRAELVIRRLASLFIRQGDERRKAVEPARLGRNHRDCRLAEAPIDSMHDQQDWYDHIESRDVHFNYLRRYKRMRAAGVIDAAYGFLE